MEKEMIYGEMYLEDKYSRLRLEKALELALLYLGRMPKSVLDIGCYTQELNKYLPWDCQYIGIDSLIKSPRVINIDLNNPEALTACFKGLPQYDLIFALEIVEHILYPDKLLSACKALLKEGGIICFSLPNENTIYHRLVMLLGFGCDAQAFKDYKHIHFGAIRQIRRFIASYFHIIAEYSYISTDMHRSRCEWMGKLARRLPDPFWQWLADTWPSLFARGRIFICQGNTAH